VAQQAKVWQVLGASSGRGFPGRSCIYFEMSRKKKKFNITVDTRWHLQELNTGFKFSEKALQSVVNERQYSIKPGESEFRLYPSGDPYIQPLDDIIFDKSDNLP